MGVATEASDVLELIGQPRRIAIIKALIENKRKDPDTTGLSFSSLFENSGIDDKGTFNYHLDTLRDYFIEKEAGEYRLTPSGTVIAGAIAAGTFSGEQHEVPIEHACSICGSEIVVAIEPGQAEIRCRDGHRGQEGHLGMMTPLPPGIAAGRSGREILELFVRHYHQMVELAVNGTCIQCYGAVNGTFQKFEIDDKTGYLYETHCDRCGYRHRAPVLALAMQHPEVISLSHENGIQIRETPPWELPFLNPEENVEVRSTDPFRVEARVPVEANEVRLTLDRHGEVLNAVSDR